MAYHDFEVGETYGLDEIVEELWRINRSGRIKNTEQKDEYIKKIASCGEKRAVFRPSPWGWCASPLNPKVWKTTDGKDLCSDS